MYSLGRVPFSQFRVLGWHWMCQLPRRHLVVTKGWLSMTCALDRFTWWPVDHTCSAKADAATSPFWSAHWYSLRRCFRVLPDCPTYTLGHSEQGSGIPRLCVSPWVQGPWDELADVWECCEDGKPLWCLEVQGFFWLSQIVGEGQTGPVGLWSSSTGLGWLLQRECFWINLSG